MTGTRNRKSTESDTSISASMKTDLERLVKIAGDSVVRALAAIESSVPGSGNPGTGVGTAISGALDALEAPMAALLRYTFEIALKRETGIQLFRETRELGLLDLEKTREAAKPSDALDAILHQIESVTYSKIEKPDAEKEINRLLDHTSTIRMAEEKDTLKYHERAMRLFDRIGEECQEAISIYGTHLGNIIYDARGKELTPLPWWMDQAARLETMTVRLTKGMTSLRDFPQAFPESQERANKLGKASSFILNLGDHLLAARAGFLRLKSDFANETVKAGYKDGTRPVSRRIENNGLIANRLTIGTGAAGALIALLIILVSGHLAAKVWVAPIALAVAAIAYLVSVTLGRNERSDVMDTMRANLRNAAGAAFFLPPASRGKGEREVEYSFAFPKWTCRLAKVEDPFFTIDWASGQAVPNFDAQQGTDLLQGHLAMSPVARQDREKALRRRNLYLLGLLAAVLWSLGWIGATPGNRNDFAFIARRSSGEACLLDRGRYLFPAGTRHFIASGWSIGVLSSRTVDSILPGDRATAVPDCNEHRPAAEEIVSTAIGTAAETEASAMREETERIVSAIGVLGETQRQVLQAVEEAASRIAGKLPIQVTVDSTGNPVPPSGMTTVVPVVVDNSRSANQPYAVGGPTLFTQIFVDGEKTGIGTEQRFLLLPLFPADVSVASVPVEERQLYDGNGPGIDTIEEAYFFGLKHNLRDPVLDGGMTLLETIGRAIDFCAGNTDAPPENPVRIEIQGFSSAKDFPGNTEESARLNWYLAEGRRAAIYQALGLEQKPSVEVANRPAVTGILSPADVGSSVTIANFAFESASKAKDGLAAWLRQTASGNTAAEEAFARSVVISFPGNSLLACN